MPNPENLSGQGFHTNPERINRKGRSGPNLSTVLRKMLSQKIDVTIDGVKQKKPFAEIIIRRLLKKASEGDIRAIIEIFDRVEGRPQPSGENDITDIDFVDLSKVSTKTLKELEQAKDKS